MLEGEGWWWGGVVGRGGPSLGMKTPLGALLSTQSRNYVPITHHTQGSASRGRSNTHPRGLCLHQLGGQHGSQPTRWRC